MACGSLSESPLHGFDEETHGTGQRTAKRVLFFFFCMACYDAERRVYVTTKNNGSDDAIEDGRNGTSARIPMDMFDQTSEQRDHFTVASNVIQH